jgi:RimJ/RimL family protein N-acetyltransferase/ribosomal protein S18 acetylase RimI-like enzyme
MKIIPATPSDAQDILALQHLAYQTEAAIYDDWTLPPLLDTLDDVASRFLDRRFLKAVDGSRIVGSVRAYQEGPTCHVERLIVHPDYRRQGIGAGLLTRIESVFPSACRFELFTGHKSKANIRLYERAGYRAFRQQQINDKVTLVFMKKTNLTIQLARLQLIAATKELLQAEADPTQLARCLQADVPDNWPTPLYDNDARQFFLSVVTEKPEAVGWTTWYILLLDTSGKKTLIGGVGACGLPDEDGKIVIGYSLLDQFQGKGFATEALRGFLDWAKQDPRLRKVIADTFPHLAASIRVLEKNGFVRRGTGADEDSIRFELAIQ